MRPVYIAKTVAITAMGPDLESLYTGLMDQKSGITKIKRFEDSSQCHINPFAGVINDLDDTKRLSLIFQLSDMLMEQLGAIEKDTFLITASTKAGIDMLKKNAKPKALSKNLLLSSLTDYIALKLKLNNSGININSACASSTIAVAKAASLIQIGVIDSALICCLDIVSEFVFSGFSAIGAMSDVPARPFDKNRKGLTLGEGAAAILLVNKEKAKTCCNAPNCQIAGWGIANDATHLTAPDKHGSGLKIAIGKACRKAKLSTGDILAINTHGTGTRYNDAMEINAILSMFNPNQITANSIKGAIGHTLGAAGGIEIALCTKMLEKKMMPGTIGFFDPEEGAQEIICPDARPLKGTCILTTNSGFGGSNAAIILKKI